MIPKLHIGTTLAALFLFFLPWIDIQCSKKSVATQSGLQMIYGGGTTAMPEAGMTLKLGNPSNHGGKGIQSLGYSGLIGLAMVAVVAAVVVSFMALWSTALERRPTVGILCAIALALIGAQALIGFPAKKSVGESVASGLSNGFAGQPPVHDNPMNAENVKIAAAMAQATEVDPLPSFYLELLMLGLPTLVLANDLIDRVKRRTASREVHAGDPERLPKDWPG